MTELIRQKVFKHCEDVGESKVRTKIESKVYGPNKLPYVLEWLRIKETTGEGARHLQTLRAMEDGNDVAREANTLSRVAIGVSIASAIMALIALVVSVR